MGKVSAVLFDFGKVLSGPSDPSVWKEMQQVSGLDAGVLDQAYWPPREEYDRGTLNSDTYWQQVAKQAGAHFDAEARARLTALDVELWTNMNAPMIAWVKQLHRSGMRTGILSNMPGAMAIGICNKFDWIGDFHHAVWSHELLLTKPDPAIYAAAARGLGVPTGEILFLDDKRENIDAAVRFGMQGIVYTDHAAFEHEMEQRGLGGLLHPAAQPA